MTRFTDLPAPEPGPDDLLLTRVLERARRTPDVEWMVQPLGGGAVDRYTWGRAVDEARRLATWIHTFDLPQGSHIGILAKNSAHFIIFELAIWMAGHATVALYPTLTAQSVRTILEHSEARLLFVGKLDGWKGMRTGVPDDLPCLACALSPEDARTRYAAWDDIITRHDPAAPQLREGSEVAALMYTSGSTGTPKGVMHTFRNMAIPPMGYAGDFNLGPHHRLFSYLPLSHTLERTLVMAISMYHGAPMYFGQSLETFTADLRAARPTLFFSIPRLWLKFQAGVFEKMDPARLRLLLRLPIVRGIVGRKVLEQLGLDQVQLAFTTSAPLPAEVTRWYESLGLTMIEGLGMTEDFGYSHASRPGHTRAGWVGHPSPGVRARIAGNGELEVKSPTLFTGYYKEPELTAEAFTPDGYLRTGDRGEIDPTGRLRLTGRVKELFKTDKGKYVAPAPIENLLNGSGLVEQSCVMGEGQGQPFAVVMLNAVARAEGAAEATRAALVQRLKALRDSVNASLDPHERLQLLVVSREEWTIGAGLLTPTLKIQRAALERRYRSRAGEWYEKREAVQFE